MDITRMDSALATARDYLLSLRCKAGYWPGYLSSSALSTATAVSALSLSKQEGDKQFVIEGINWLKSQQNPDGGWGDTPDSPSNLSTSLLVISAMKLAGVPADDFNFTLGRGYVCQVCEGDGIKIVEKVTRVYGKDRTFAVPILMNCALAGLVPWYSIPALPVEFAAFPRRWFHILKLDVVSYALPALIAIGLLLRQRKPFSLFKGAIARLLTSRLMKKLEHLQPQSGGFLEATPLTAFVAMSLLSQSGASSRVIERCLQFLRESIRTDGSWPIDTNLSIWTTTNAISALRISGELPPIIASAALKWVTRQQVTIEHPYTGAAPGGWGWSHLSGSVPDVDDTAGALLTLATTSDDKILKKGAHWLLSMQNSDGGWPTFCRGWGHLPFDQSCPDLTAHVIRALQAMNSHTTPEMHKAVENGLIYLLEKQQKDGYWLPLWFGDQTTPDQHNPVYGTARVLLALGDIAPLEHYTLRGVDYLLRAQLPDGSWGGAIGTPACIENTAVALSALTKFPHTMSAIEAGKNWLIKQIEADNWKTPTPIGLYFASLWYSEQIYPVAWTVEALGRIRRMYYAARSKQPDDELLEQEIV